MCRGSGAKCPKDDSSWESSVPNSVTMASTVRTDVKEDWTILVEFALQAESRLKARKAIAASAAVVASAADDEHHDDVLPDMLNNSVDEPAFPRGKHGSATSKLRNKVHGLLLELKKPNWRMQVKESTIRSQIRFAAKLENDLKQSEFPHLLVICSDMLVALNAMQSLVNAELKIKKDESSANIMAFTEPLDALMKHLQKFDKTGRLDDELVMYQVWRSLDSAPSRFGRPVTGVVYFGPRVATIVAHAVSVL